MKKSIASILIAVLSLLAIIFCVLWQHTVHNQSDFTTFAQAEANKAYTSFSTYQKSGDDGDYWQGSVWPFDGGYKQIYKSYFLQ